MRLLLISFWFEPNANAASARASMMASTLAAHGYDVYIVSKDFTGSFNNSTWSRGVKRSNTVLLSIKKILAFLPLRMKQVVTRLVRTYSFEPEMKSWNKNALRRSLRILGEQKFDVIYATTPPFSTLGVAKAASHLTEVQWVAEFRDLWSDNHAYDLPQWRRRMDRVREVEMVASASALVTVSKPLAETLLEMHKKPVWVVKNGADFQRVCVNKESTIAPDTKLRLAYTGTIYFNHYEWKGLLEGIRYLHEFTDDIRLSVAGDNLQPFIRYAKKIGVLDSIYHHGLVSQEAALDIQQQADCLVFFTWKNAEGILTSKLSEYIASRRPILMVGPETDVSRHITNLGRASLAQNASEVAFHLGNYLAQKKNYHGRIPDSCAELPIEFSAHYQFELLRQKLTELVAGDRSAK